MKFIHISDLHVDSPLTAHLPADKVRERRAELAAVLSSTVDEAMRLGVRIIIIAGDLFDSDRITKTARRRTLALISAAKEISFFYLPGNHEEGALVAGEEELPQNLFVFGEDWSYFSSGDTVIAGRSKTSPDMFETLSLPLGTTNVVVLHGELRDRSDFNGIIGRRDAAGRGIDYLALGHYHSYSTERIDDKCIAVYPGTPEGRGFDETGRKGYVLVEREVGPLIHRFIPRARRILHEIEVDISALTDHYAIEKRAETALADARSCDLVRLILVGSRRVGFIPDTAALTARLADRYYYFEAKDETRLSISASDYEHDLSLKGEFIRMVMRDETMSEKKKEDVISCGLAALLGEGDL